LTKYEQDRILRMQENAAVSKSLGVPSLVSSMTQAMMNTSQNRNAKGKDFPPTYLVLRNSPA